jgi:hypothetical protein
MGLRQHRVAQAEEAAILTLDLELVAAWLIDLEIIEKADGFPGRDADLSRNLAIE